MTDLVDIPDLASDLSATAMLIIKSNNPDVHGELQMAFTAALAPFEAENQRLRDALREIINHCANTGRGNALVNDRIYERCEETARAALSSTEASHDD